MKKLSSDVKVVKPKTAGVSIGVFFVLCMFLLMMGFDVLIKLNWWTILYLILLLAFGVLMYLLISGEKTDDVLDEVYEDGETLLLKRSGKECRVPLADIKNICFSGNGVSEVMLFLRHSTEWGDHLRYYACVSAKDLVERIDRMRNVDPDVVGDVGSEIEPIHEKLSKRISSEWIAFKYCMISFGVISMVVIGIKTAFGQDNSRLDNIIWMPKFLFAVVAVVFVKRMMTHALFFWRAIEKVFDGGDHLLLKKSGREERIPLRNIKNVSYSNVLFPFRVTLDLRHPCQWGDRVVFLPPSLLFSEKRNGEMIDDLIDRIDRARIAASSNPSSVAMTQPSGHWKSKEDGQMEQGAGSQAME